MTSRRDSTDRRRLFEPQPGVIRWVRRLAFVGCCVAACIGLALLADADDFTGPILVLAGADAAAVLVLGSAAGLPAIHETGQVVRRVALPLTGTLVLQLVAGLAMFPLTREEGVSPDYSWFAVVPFVVLLIGGGSVLLAVIVYVCVLVPPITLVRLTPAAIRGDPQAQTDVGFAALILTVVAFATAVVMSLPPDSGRRSIVSLVTLLLGVLDPDQDAPGWVLWAARALLVVVVAICVLLARHERHHRTIVVPWKDEASQRRRGRAR